MTSHRSTRALLFQFLRFGIVGISNTFIAYAIYAVLVLLHVHYLIANAAAFVAGVLNAFYWSNKYVFKKTSKKQDYTCNNTHLSSNI